MIGQTSEAREQARKALSQLVKQVWADNKLKQRLLDNPATVLQERGVEVPTGWEVRVVEPPDKVLYLALPPKPVDVEFTESELSGVAGAWLQLVKQVSADDKLKQRLLDSPATVLQERGVEVPAGWEVRVVEPPDNVRYLVLPPKPVGVELTDSELSGVAGGAGAEDDDMSGGELAALILFGVAIGGGVTFRTGGGGAGSNW